jgi:hypothetical protein
LAVYDLLFHAQIKNNNWILSLPALHPYCQQLDDTSHETSHHQEDHFWEYSITNYLNALQDSTWTKTTDDRAFRAGFDQHNEDKPALPPPDFAHR